MPATLKARCLLAACAAGMMPAVAAVAAVPAAPARAAECVVPSKPGGAMDLTCKLAQKALNEKSAASSMRLTYMPGGIGAVAWHTMVSQRAADGDTLVAFSGGSLLNLAQGKFGNASAGDVRWVAALGADYGMIAVRADSQYKTLADLLAALKRDPKKVLIGVSGTIGSQDWLKMAILARSAGVDPRALRFVALEGGGEAFTALDANYVQVVPGDASEATLYAGAGKVRVLAVLSAQRLPGVLSNVPTAREQGVDMVWPIIRGVWMGPKASDADYQRWVRAFDQMEASPEFAQMRAAYGFYPFSMTGAPLTAYVKQAVEDYRRTARDFKLVR
ncbi:tripartite tricarboxylate transporter substrate binding protein [Massilia sp. DWR3-1-1]|uniref:tripartite tricarboxylate transporter substrate binding protein n=1 Tax=Massilia sp. DWR3-1-1 TaxID=2804559 RepID=UPI003CF784C8